MVHHRLRHQIFMTARGIGKQRSDKMSKSRPTDVQEVEAYINTNNYSVDAEEFYDHMLTVGWKYGKAKHDVKDWQACIRTWHRRARKDTKQVLL